MENKFLRINNELTPQGIVHRNIRQGSQNPTNVRVGKKGRLQHSAYFTRHTYVRGKEKGEEFDRVD